MEVEIFFDKDDGSTKIRLLEPIVFRYREEELEVPIGFVSDGCSCPKTLWGYCEALDEKYMRAYIIHDFRL